MDGAGKAALSSTLPQPAAGARQDAGAAAAPAPQRRGVAVGASLSRGPQDAGARREQLARLRAEVEADIYQL